MHTTCQDVIYISRQFILTSTAKSPHQHLCTCTLRVWRKAFFFPYHAATLRCSEICRFAMYLPLQPHALNSQFSHLGCQAAAVFAAHLDRWQLPASHSHLSGVTSPVVAEVPFLQYISAQWEVHSMELTHPNGPQTMTNIAELPNSLSARYEDQI